MNELREIDALVAEHVMGLDVKFSPAEKFIDNGVEREAPAYHWISGGPLLAYSRDMESAWLVVEHMRGDYIFSLLDHITSWSASFVKLRGIGSKSIEAPTAPLAICLAALDVIPNVAMNVAKEDTKNYGAHPNG